MDREVLQQLVDEANDLSNFLYYQHAADPRFPRLYAKAQRRERRRAERLFDYELAEAEHLIEIQAEHAWRQQNERH